MSWIEKLTVSRQTRQTDRRTVKQINTCIECKLSQSKIYIFLLLDIQTDSSSMSKVKPLNIILEENLFRRRKKWVFKISIYEFHSNETRERSKESKWMIWRRIINYDCEGTRRIIVHCLERRFTFWFFLSFHQSLTSLISPPMVNLENII